MKTLIAFLVSAILTAQNAFAGSSSGDFVERDSPAAIQALAAQINTKMNQPGLNSVSDLTAFGKVLHQRLLEPERFGIPADVVDPKHGFDEGAHAPMIPGKGMNPAVLQAADRLLNDQVIGRPGAVDWSKIPGRFGAASLNPLALAFISTGDQRYLRRWCEFLDDWSLRESLATDPWPIEFPMEYSKGIVACWHLLKLWGGVAERLKDEPETFPTFVMLRCWNKVLPTYPMLTFVHHRGNPRNWTVENAYFYVALGLFFDDFQIGPDLVSEGFRVIEMYGVLHNMRDGTENQQLFGYNGMYLHSAKKISDLLVAAEKTGKMPKTATVLATRPGWKQELDANRLDRANRMIRLVTPDKRMPVPLRNDLRTHPLDWYAAICAGLELEPESQAILDWFRSRSKGPLPSVTSEAFPFGGYWVLRSGWRAEDSYGMLFCSPQPGAWAGFNSGRNNNALAITAFSEDVIVAGDRGTYMQRPSPLRVDGLHQAFHLGTMVAPPAWDQPGQGRFHSSDQFVVAEGIYDGPYGVRPGNYEPDAHYRAWKAALNGVRHERVVVFVKPATWLVFDRVMSEKPRELALDWRLPITPVNAKQYRAFKPKDIHLVNGSVPRVEAKRPGGTHLEMSFAASASLSLKSKKENKKGEKAGAPVSDFLVVEGTWKSEGEGRVISWIHPWRGETPAVAPQTLSTPTELGFAGPQTGGKTLVARYSRKNTAILKSGESEFQAELLVAEADGSKGIVLGCSAMRWQGKPVSIPATDFEFSYDNEGGWKFDPIFRPIENVKVSPERTLLEPGERISLSCATPDTEIRYTLDGSEVSADALLYQNPISLNETVWLRARAYRKGNPWKGVHQNATHRSYETRAVFEMSQGFWAPVQLPEKTAPGLAVRTVRGTWDKLWYGHSGPANGPDVATYAEGFLLVPKTGIYTFVAPASYTHDNGPSGIELRLELDGKPWRPEARRHAFGRWSVPLEAGAHQIVMTLIDYRRDGVKRFNRVGMRLNRMTEEGAPKILLLQPGEAMPSEIPAEWLKYSGS